jgi:2-C-methyl-D-erythritol 4-phosphate cytidylyltransferase
MIRECYNAAAGKGAVIPVIPVVDTLRHISGRTVDRSDYMAVQTPQVFTIDLLKKAFQQPYSPHFTDDASVVEAYGHTVSTVEGCRENIKITTPYDLKISEAIVG